MQITIFDIETNAIDNFITLQGLKTIHCIAVMDRGDEDAKLLPIEEALEHMRKADILVGHNAHSFDIPCLQHFYPDWKPTGCIRDTLLMTRIAWPDIKTEDFRNKEFPNSLVGRHSLKAWGVRMGILKGDFSESNQWDEYTDEMGEYCKQDVRVTAALWSLLEDQNLNPDVVMLEHSFANIIRQQERNGIGFNVEGAKKLYTKLVAEKIDIETKMRKEFPPTVIHMKKPEYYFDINTRDIYDTKTEAPKEVRKYLEPGPLKKKIIPFNPGSRMEIANVFINKYGWKPKEFTGEGRPKVDEATLSSLKYPEAQDLVKFLTIQKRLGMLSDGNEAWLKLEKNGRIHGEVNTNGAISSRCTHRRCNMAQVPSVGSPWGEECRSLFNVPEGKVMVGVDASGLELRCLAHYMFPWDNGKYVKELLEGDIHTANQKAAGLSDRAQAKVMIYCMIYGGGDEKLGSIINGGRREGRTIRNKFFKQVPALKYLTEAVKKTAKENKVIKALDGRYLPVRSQHSALNLLLQSAGAIIMKKATELMHVAFQENKLSDKILQVAHVHDEVQFEVERGIEDEVGELSVDAIRRAGYELSFRCPLDGESRSGKNWAETH
tara:strand:- start:15333 stop:17144 length:1812 start_codon:yes stop_codon:yes gene_type:complete